MPKPLPEVTPNSWSFLRDAMIKPTGFREYDARWKYPEEINLPGMTALGLGLGTQMIRRGIEPVIAVGSRRTPTQALRRTINTTADA